MTHSHINFSLSLPLFPQASSAGYAGANAASSMNQGNPLDNRGNYNGRDSSSWWANWREHANNAVGLFVEKDAVTKKSMDDAKWWSTLKRDLNHAAGGGAQESQAAGRPSSAKRGRNLLTNELRRHRQHQQRRAERRTGTAETPGDISHFCEASSGSESAQTAPPAGPPGPPEQAGSAAPAAGGPRPAETEEAKETKETEKNETRR